MHSLKNWKIIPNNGCVGEKLGKAFTKRNARFWNFRGKSRGICQTINKNVHCRCWMSYLSACLCSNLYFFLRMSVCLSIFRVPALFGRVRDAISTNRMQIRLRVYRLVFIFRFKVDIMGFELVVFVRFNGYGGIRMRH